MIRVGFVVYFGDGWLGGINYFRNLLTAVYELPDRKIEAVIFTGIKTPAKHFDGFPAVEIVRSRFFDRGGPFWLLQKISQYYLPIDFIMTTFLHKNAVAVLSHAGWLGRFSKIPAIGWIPDFQHVHLPGYFSKKELAARNRLFHGLCQQCATVIVSSFDAQADLLNFAGACQNKVEVLQFVAAPANLAAELLSYQQLQQKYRFSGHYFLLPNQFWRHKNHIAVIEALDILKHEGQQVLVLATGNTVDYRHPEYFETLMSRAKELNVADSFRVLGMVPSEDLAALMRHAIAIVNPSFFEGWSSSVEEAKSLGKPIILSDIPVHREQKPAFASYFPPENARLLADLLAELWRKLPVGEAIETAYEKTMVRRNQFAREYQQIVLRALAK